MRKFSACLIVLFCFIASGCGFHLRSANHTPTQLRTAYFSSTKPYGALSTQLRELLNASGVKLVKNAAQAPYSIEISSDIFTYSRPDVVDSSLPTSMNFIQTGAISIVYKGKTIATQTFNASQSITLNANQIYTSNANNFIKDQLIRNVVSSMYYWLLSNNTRDALHAAQSKTARHAAR